MSADVVSDGALVHIGFGNYASARLIVAVSSPMPLPVRRAVRQARAAGTLIDLTHGRRTKAALFMATGAIILAAITPETIATRAAREPAP